jgi:hypothetical protein
MAKFIVLVLILLMSIGSVHAQANDIWAGTYAITFTHHSGATTGQPLNGVLTLWRDKGEIAGKIVFEGGSWINIRSATYDGSSRISGSWVNKSEGTSGDVTLDLYNSFNVIGGHFRYNDNGDWDELNGNRR